MISRYTTIVRRWSLSFVNLFNGIVRSEIKSYSGIIMLKGTTRGKNKVLDI
jgi:hypothetical protein